MNLLGFFPIARTTFDMALAEQVIRDARARLEAAGFTLVGPDAPVTAPDEASDAIRTLAAAPPDLVVVLQATFADSGMVMALAQAVDAPLLLWAVPEERLGGRLRLNSLCGINLAAHALTRAGLTYEYLYAAPDDDRAPALAGTLARAGRARRILKAARIGRVGENPAGFETCLFDEAAIRQQFGAEVVQIGLPTVFEAARAADPQAVEAVAEGLRVRVDGLDDLDPTPTRGTLGVYLALRDLAENRRLDGLAVRCWPEFFTDLGCAACGAMSMMSNDGTPCSCEADVNGTLTQVMLQAISGEAAFGSDIVAVDDERDGLVLWHCGLAPLSMADPASRPGVTIHSNRKLPLLFQFTLKPGRVTLARLSQAKGGWRLVVGEGEVQRAPGAFSGTTGVVRFERPAQDVLDTILTEGLEHHVSLTYGDHAGVLYSLAKMLELPVLVL
ncbi:MAG: fucose isomerase [Chloroflexi bacterium]|nr:fucose isomerase [Chloroflexota bacterium]MDL1882320.1 fucose isomerase [Anaerolineae bacterium CFX8]